MFMLMYKDTKTGKMGNLLDLNIWVDDDGEISNVTTVDMVVGTRKILSIAYSIDPVDLLAWQERHGRKMPPANVKRKRT